MARGPVSPSADPINAGSAIKPDGADAAEAFACALAVRAPELGVRAEDDGDVAFLRDLFVRCSRLRDVLPPPMLAQQAELQRQGHRAQHPQATRCILLRAVTPIGRIVIDWTAEAVSHCVDVAILPEHRFGGVGRRVLKAWLDVADARRNVARLRVLRDNPALRTYAALGLFAAADDDPMHPFAMMIRMPT